LLRGVKKMDMPTPTHTPTHKTIILRRPDERNVTRHGDDVHELLRTSVAIEAEAGTAHGGDQVKFTAVPNVGNKFLDQISRFGVPVGRK
jgi:hypothetical protein